MTLHLIDGRAGRAHITSDDIARLNTALVGERHCVFEYLEDLKCTMQSSGRAMISTGAGMVDGHRFVVSSAETVQLSGGSAGMKRIDIVYVQHSIESGDVYTGKEKVEFSVARGTPHASNPLPPSTPSNSFALWRIPVDGINFGTPEAMFDLVPTVASMRVKLLYQNDFWRVVKHGGAVSVCIPVDGINFGTPEAMFDLVPTVASMRVKLLYQNDFWRVVKHGGAVSVCARGVITDSGSSAALDCKYTVPSELRPAVEVLSACVTQNGDSGAGFIRVTSDGKISVGQLGGTGSREPRYAQLTWVPGV